MAAAESSRHRKTEGLVDGPDAAEHPQSERAAESPLQQQSGLRVSPHTADAGSTVGAASACGSKRYATEHQRDKNTGIGAEVVREREPSQHLGAEQQGGQARQEARRDEELLYKAHLGPQQLSKQQQE